MPENGEETTLNYEYAQNHANDNHNWEYPEFYRVRKNQWRTDDFKEKSNYEFTQNHAAEDNHNSWEYQEFYKNRQNQWKTDEMKDFNENKNYEDEKKFRKISAIGMLTAYALILLGFFTEQRWLVGIAFLCEKFTFKYI